MKTLARLTLSFVVVGLLSTSLPAESRFSVRAAFQNSQDVLANELNAKVIKLYREGNLKDALPLAKKVLDLRTASNDPNKAGVVEALYNLGVIYQALYDLKNSLQQFQRALEINRSLRPSDISNAKILDQIGKIYDFQQDERQAVEAFREALTLREEVLGQEHLEVIQSVLNLALIYEGSGNHEEAAKLFERFFKAKHLLSAEAQARSQEEILEFACRSRSRGNTKAADNLEATLSIVQVKGTTDDGNAPKGDSINGRALELGRPPYPAIARSAHASGAVEVRVVIDESGKVIFACVVRGHPLLQAAAKAAAFDSNFTPTLRNGRAIKVTGTIIYNFIAQ